jgi:hypothetical protein
MQGRKDGPMRYFVAACALSALLASALFIGGWGGVWP